MLLSDETILGKKLASASSSAMTSSSAFNARTACILISFELAPVRLSSITSTAAPKAGMFSVAVMASLPWCMRRISVKRSIILCNASDRSSSEVAAMPLSVEEDFAKKVKRIRSCPDKAGSRAPPQPARSRHEMHCKHSSRARTGTCCEILSTWDIGTNAYSESLASIEPGRAVIDWSVMSKLVSACTNSFLASGLCPRLAVMCRSCIHGCFS